jgi:hypothetical protein
MTDNKESALKTFMTDFFTVTLVFTVLLFAMTILSIVVIGSREEGMGFGVIIGFVAGLAVFYYFRGHFNLRWTIGQVIVNAGLTIGEFYLVSDLFDGSSISELSYGYVLIIISVPTLISLNRQLIDFLTAKVNGEGSYRRYK